MVTLLCREAGLNCDYIIKGETEEEILKNGAEHVIQVHGMNVEDIYLNALPANFLCQTIPKLESPIED
jgi:predicted small metal-binding protein